MALGGTYDTGTISVSADGTIIAGVVWANGHIADPWTGGELTNAGYRIIKLSWLRYDPALTQAKLRAVMAALEVLGWPPAPISVISAGRSSSGLPSIGSGEP